MEILTLKLIIVSLIHTSLLSLVLYFKYKTYSSKIKIFNKKTIFIPLLFLFFFIFSKLILQLNNTTMYVCHAAILTICYIEIAIYLEKSFWRDFLQNSLPFSINLLLSFTLMINAGYFTLMFIIHILESNNVI